MSDITISKARAVAVFAALGITAAARWNATRMNAKINKIDEQVDEDTEIEDKEVKADLDAILEALENDGTVTVEAAGKGGKADKPASGKADKPASGKADKPADKPKKEKPKKDKKPPAPKGPPGVRETRTRPFLAGCIIKEQGGLKAGVTEDMVKELDERYGKENPAESTFCLRNAWHAIRGFDEGDTATEEEAE